MSAERDEKGRFPPGQSGNPKGRPPGRGNERTEFLDALLGEDGEKIVQQLRERAIAGDKWAVRLAVDRLLPMRMERRVKVDLAAVDSAAAVSTAVAQVIALTADGQLTTQEAFAFLRLIEFQRRAIETNELAGRLEVLESVQRGEDVDD